ncbi:thiamine diphosphokinase [Parabacteroides sp. OttesenSCG-928-K15]|nr:thiamine diphosphokinase [Parabacteroides sp. OttesenSCG-928-K15]
MIRKYPCVVVADGLFPSRPSLLEILREAEIVIACDGATATLLEHNIIPTAIVGDMDSIPEALKKQFADRIHKDNDQECNDLTKAVRYAQSLQQREVLILGATGLREDHMLGNISLLADYAASFDQVEMASDHGLFTPISKTTTFASVPGQQVSFFSLHAGGLVTTDRLRYPLRDKDLTAWWQGTLNEALGTEFSLILSNEAKMIVFRTWE